MLRAVLDTNVFLRAVLNSRSFAGRLLGELTGEYRLIVSQAIFLEVMKILSHPDLQAKSSNVAKLDYGMIASLFDTAELVEPHEIPPTCRDPKDDMLLACAKTGEADYLVSEDKDLLALKVYGRTIICRSFDFVAILEANRASKE